MNIVEKEVTRWELASVDAANVYRAELDDCIHLWWTPIEEFKALTLNIFSPFGSVFWNFAEYQSFRSGAVEYMHRLRAKESTVGILDEVIRETGAELRSEVSSVLLGGFTSYFGDRYEPRYGIQQDSMGRHLSIAVPESCQPMVSRYFHEQVRVFGESATKPCADEVTLGYSRDESDQTLAGLLVKGVFSMSEAERNAVVALIHSGIDFLTPERPHHFCFTGNAIAMSALGLEESYPWFDDFAVIARFRLKTAVERYSLARIEKLKQDLDRPEWGLLRLADLRDEMRGRLSAVLAKHPVIETNPFELWDGKP